MLRRQLLQLLLWSAAASPLAALAQTHYSITVSPSLFGAAGIDNQGRVVGALSFRPLLPHAAIWSGDRLIDIGTSFRAESRAVGVSDNGVVLGLASAPGPFLYWRGKITYIGDFTAYAVNNKLQVVGEKSFAPNSSRAVLWQHGKLLNLGTLGGSFSGAYGINNKGEAVGYSLVTDEPNATLRGFVYRDGKMKDVGILPGGTFSVARVINDAGVVAGVANAGGRDEPHAFIYVHGVIRDIGSFGGDTTVEGINNRGHVVGSATDARNVPRGYIYRDGRLLDLNNLIDRSLGWRVIQARDINDKGQIVVLLQKVGRPTSYYARLDPIHDAHCDEDHAAPDGDDGGKH
jgi:probable HAF family extracellular repeat protein